MLYVHDWEYDSNGFPFTDSTTWGKIYFITPFWFTAAWYHLERAGVKNILHCYITSFAVMKKKSIRTTALDLWSWFGDTLWNRKNGEIGERTTKFFPHLGGYTSTAQVATTQVSTAQALAAHVSTAHVRQLPRCMNSPCTTCPCINSPRWQLTTKRGQNK